jgi:futalosine hydrolase
VVVEAAGVGEAATAAVTARRLAEAEARGEPFEAVICAGIAGGFADKVPVGGLAVATESVAADLGAASPDGFIPLDELGFGTARRTVDPGLFEQLRAALPGAAVGAILTVATVTGTVEMVQAAQKRHPGAVAEGMEGFGVATAVALHNDAARRPHEGGAARGGRQEPATGPRRVAFAEVRAISNVVGPRDRSAWQIAPALGALRNAFARLTGVTRLAEDDSAPRG